MSTSPNCLSWRRLKTCYHNSYEHHYYKNGREKMEIHYRGKDMNLRRVWRSRSIELLNVASIQPYAWPQFSALKEQWRQTNNTIRFLSVLAMIDHIQYHSVSIVRWLKWQNNKHYTLNTNDVVYLRSIAFAFFLSTGWLAKCTEYHRLRIGSIAWRP
jgi:hypothetical protein